MTHLRFHHQTPKPSVFGTGSRPLFRKLISVAPGQRVPRHRLIHNLIEAGEFDLSSNEIRIFENELRRDAPIIRYKATLLMARANHVKGLMTEDRLAILNEAAGIVKSGIRTFSSDKGLYRTYCDIGLQIVRLSGKWEVFDAALESLIAAEKEYLDPEMGRMIARIRARAEEFVNPSDCAG